MERLRDLKIIDTAYGGYGVAKAHDGKVVFVPHTVEGDTVEARIVEDKKSLVYAKLTLITSVSDKREPKPKCKFMGVCGGCLFGHIKYDEQIAIKRNVLDGAFRKYNSKVPAYDVVRSESSGYRLRVTMQVRNGKVGYYRFKSRDFVATDRCNILSDSLFQKITDFVTYYNTFCGEIYAIETADGKALATVEVVSGRLDMSGTISFDGVEIYSKVFGSKKIDYIFDDGVVSIAHKTFFQSNRYLLDEFRRYAVSLVDTSLPILELYAGAGFFTTGLQRCKKYLAGIENDALQVELGKAAGYNIVKAEAANYLKTVNKVDQIFLDPPRDGVSKAVINELKRVLPKSIVYVSCNPITLGRDIANLQDDYSIDSIKLFDMYPDTYHIETVVRLKIRTVL